MHLEVFYLELPAPSPEGIHNIAGGFNHRKHGIIKPRRPEGTMQINVVHGAPPYAIFSTLHRRDLMGTEAVTGHMFSSSVTMLMLIRFHPSFTPYQNP